MKKLFGILVLLVFCLSCSDVEICTETDLLSRAGLSFMVRDENSERDTILEQVTFYSVLNPDSLIIAFAPQVRSFVFPLPQEAGEENSFVLISGSNFDTIRIRHIPKLELVSFNCGFTTIHDLQSFSYGNTLIDTIVITNTYVSRENEENIQIYVHPAVADTLLQ